MRLVPTVSFCSVIPMSSWIIMVNVKSVQGVSIEVILLINVPSLAVLMMSFTIVLELVRCASLTSFRT